MSDIVPVIPPVRAAPAYVKVALFPDPDTDADIGVEVSSTAAGLPSTDWFQERLVSADTAKNFQAGGIPGHLLTFWYPRDGVRRYYRARHVRSGWTASTYSRTVSALPNAVSISATGIEHIGDVLNPVSPEGAIMLGIGSLSASSMTAIDTVTGTFSASSASIGDVDLDTAYVNTDLAIGTAAVPGSVGRVISIPAVQLVPDSTSQSYLFDSFGRWAGCNGSGVATFHTGFTVVPGVTLSGLTVSAARDSTTDAVTVNLYRSESSDPTNVTTVASLNSTGTGWHFMQTSTVSDTPSSGSHYAVSVITNPSSGSTGAVVGTVSFSYDVDSLVFDLL